MGLLWGPLRRRVTEVTRDGISEGTTADTAQAISGADSARGWFAHTPSRTFGALALALVLGAVACGGADQAPPGDAPSLRALLSIERIEEASGEQPSASAMAQFVVLPSETDARDALDAAGLRSEVPDRAGCAEVALPEVARADANMLVPEQLELLEAGEVDIHAGGVVTRLALNLFPPSGSASGVIYTTPDQSADPLPADSDYSINATGSDSIPRLAIEGRAPGSLREVTLGGLPLATASVHAGQPLDLTWVEGDPADRVLVQLSDAETAIQCSFADMDGSGSVPGSLTARLAPASNARISLHRMREAVRTQEPQRADAMILETTVRFDFELTSVLRVQ